MRGHFKVGRATDKVPVTVTRAFLNSFGSKPSQVECGIVMKHAFPEVQRKRSNNKWYYYGLQCIDQKALPSSPKKETCENENAFLVACTDEHIDEQVISGPTDFHEDTNGTNTASVITQQVNLNTKNMESCKPAEQQTNFRPFCIPFLNLCKEDMSDLTQGQLIGEGTFGYCISGSYKGVSAAFKVFKDFSHYNEVHAEANILLKIPSHPGIPMLIGVYTTSTPFVLATKLCKIAGKPETYSSFLRSQQEDSRPNLRLALYLLLSVGEALSHIFSVGILHNDIKGNNVVLEDANGLKRGVLIDFGKACYVEDAKGNYVYFCWFMDTCR